MTDARLSAALIGYIATQPEGAYVHDIAANVIGCGSYTDLRRALERLTSASYLAHTVTGREGVWADRWTAVDPATPSTLKGRP